ncbi:putative tail protein X [Roseibium sp. TrichSKD4]|uniref:tail protein X n=1 Tax=Roseibium sp. TrichSKD4 TaxID=744980 RepID=UPI0001E56F40|nr:tail protein X [Roseibium sp. TrichSKD4]EFO31323.1 putative tail protein X [Roseibium sp. TrichSKD4]
MADYETKAGDMVDAICADQLPDVDVSHATDETYKLNAFLALEDIVLPAGLKITLPDTSKEQVTRPLRVWG